MRGFAHNNKKMKKIVTIKIETDTNHPSKDEWLKPSDFYLNEIDDALDDIRAKGKYRNRSGSVSEATRYTISVSKNNSNQ